MFTDLRYSTRSESNLSLSLSKGRSKFSSPMGTARFLGFLLLLLLSPVNLFLDGVAAGLFGWSSREPKYNVEFHLEDAPFHSENGQESIVMTKKEGQKYICFFPIVEETGTVQSFIPQNLSNTDSESERRIKFKTPDELLHILKDECLYRREGWWSYEFCYQKRMRQIHVENDKVVQEFVLGIYDPEATATYNQTHSDASIYNHQPLKDFSQSRYHAHQYTGGTICDLTNQHRETEVRFVCSKSTFSIGSVNEISSCKYVVTIQSPTLCQNPLFQQEEPTQKIHCNEIPSDIGDLEDDGKGTHVPVITEEYKSHATT